ncbi:Gfo/Idh/MocA family protein [Promicromonospora sp. Populi]|uniref:Gfo/Idh/MocA family protein n=1 Tax=Promicromonospora sp. Populi TaxID=3239420 RepID=UPI0034E1E95D
MTAARPKPGTPARIAVMSFAHTHAKTYIQILKNYPDVELLTSDPGAHPAKELRGRAAAEELGVSYVETYAELLAWRPHGVIIASENARHRQDVEVAVAAGADILCEKPLATTLEDGLAIRDAVELAGVRLMVAFPVRFATNFGKLKTDHQAGLLGTVVAVRGSNNGKLPTERAWFTDPQLAGGGALVDHIVHIADLIEGLTGATPTSVTAIANRKLHSERAHAETAALVTISYDDGSIAAVDCSWSHPNTAPTWGGLRVVVAGTEGATEIDFFAPRAHGLQSATGLPVELPYGPNFNEPLLKTFIESVRTGTSAQPDVEVGLKTLKIVLAAQESADTGRTVAIH